MNEWTPLLPSDDWQSFENQADYPLNAKGDPVAETIAILTRRRPYYHLFRAYHRGIHRLMFQSPKFKNLFGGMFRGFADNLMPVVVDTYSDRLQIERFDVLEGGGQQLSEDISTLWQRERFDQIASDIHRESLITGDGYAIVWPESGDLAKPSVYPQLAGECVVAHDPDAPDQILWASKMWLSSDRYRLNVYWPNEILKYQTVPQPTVPYFPSKPEEFIPIEDATIPNPYNRVPVFHYRNGGRIGTFGESELRPLIPLQDALNKSVIDMLVGFEFVSLPQRYATGIELAYDEHGNPVKPFEPGVDRVWLSSNPDAKFGQFEPASMNSFVDVQETFRREIARISGIPMYYMLQTGQFPSGDALRMAEARLVSRCERKQGVLGNSWEEVMAFYLELIGKGRTVLLAQWKYPSPVDPSKTIETLIQKQQIGVPKSQLLLEAGYGQEMVDQMLEEQEVQAQNLADLAQARFDAGQIN